MSAEIAGSRRKKYEYFLLLRYLHLHPGPQLAGKVGRATELLPLTLAKLVEVGVYRGEVFVETFLEGPKAPPYLSITPNGMTYLRTACLLYEAQIKVREFLYAHPGPQTCQDICVGVGFAPKLVTRALDFNELGRWVARKGRKNPTYTLTDSYRQSLRALGG